MNISIKCPACGEPDVVSDAARGKNGQCNRCHHIFRIVAETQIIEAQKNIAKAIGTALALWFVPIVSGVACNVAEHNMVHTILESLGLHPIGADVDALFWFFRKKYFIVNVVTYIPWVGPAVQVLEVYALGQFVLACALRSEFDLSDERAMANGWKLIEPDIWSGEKVVDFYEQFGGNSFPEKIRPEFIRAVNAIGHWARTVEHLPGLTVVQEVAGEGVRRGVNAIKSLYKKFNG